MRQSFPSHNSESTKTWRRSSESTKVRELVEDSTTSHSPMPRRHTVMMGGQEENGGRMFDLFPDKAQVEILDSAQDDALAAAMYANVKRHKNKKKKKEKKQKRRVSGYDFDALLAKEESSSSSTTSDAIYSPYTQRKSVSGYSFNL